MFSAVCWLDFVFLFVANTKKKVEYTEVTKI